MTELYEEAKREVARFLLERHSSKGQGILNRIKRKFQGVKIRERSVLNTFYGRDAPFILKRFAKTLEGHADTKLRAAILKTSPPLPRDRPILAPEDVEGQILLESVRMNIAVGVEERTVDPEIKTAAYIEAKNLILKALEKEGLLRRKNRVVHISNMHARKLSEFLRKNAS